MQCKVIQISIWRSACIKLKGVLWNLNIQKGRKFICSATPRISFDPLQQFIFHALYLYLPWPPYMQFYEFLELQSTNSTHIKIKCRINYLIYRIVQKYIIQLIIFWKLIVQDMQCKLRRKHGKGNLRNQKGRKFSHSATSMQ